MKILNINSYYYSSSVHQQLQNTLYKHKLDILTYVPLTEEYIPREECQYGSEENIIASNCYKKYDRYIFHIKHNKIIKDIQNNIKFNSIDVMHAHSLFSNGYIALKIKQKYNIPYIVAVRDTDINIFFKYMIHLRKLGLSILEEASKIIFLSNSYRDLIISKYIKSPKLKQVILEKSIIIPNGIDDFWFKNKGEKKEIINKKIISLIFIGPISKRKNLITTTKVVDNLINKGYTVSLTVVGKIQNKVIYNRIKKLKYVKYKSLVKKDELINIYRSNDIYVMPSLTETFGLVYAEAMSQGLPVIYTKGQGFDGQFTEGHIGYHVNCFNVDEISSKIEQIIYRYEEISENCISNFQLFDWNIISKKYFEIYLKLQGEH